MRVIVVQVKPLVGDDNSFRVVHRPLHLLLRVAPRVCAPVITPVPNNSKFVSAERVASENVKHRVAFVSWFY